MGLIVAVACADSKTLDRASIDQPPSLRFDTGNVIIKLGEDPTGWLLVHKHVIQATIPVLSHALDEGWNRQEIIKDLKSNEDHKVYSFALKCVDNAWLLEGRVSDGTASIPFS